MIYKNKKASISSINSYPEYKEIGQKNLLNQTNETSSPPIDWHDVIEFDKDIPGNVKSQTESVLNKMILDPDGIQTLKDIQQTNNNYDNGRKLLIRSSDFGSEYRYKGYEGEERPSVGVDASDFTNLKFINAAKNYTIEEVGAQGMVAHELNHAANLNAAMERADLREKRESDLAALIKQSPDRSLKDITKEVDDKYALDYAAIVDSDENLTVTRTDRFLKNQYDQERVVYGNAIRPSHFPHDLAKDLPTDISAEQASDIYNKYILTDPDRSDRAPEFKQNILTPILERDGLFLSKPANAVELDDKKANDNSDLKWGGMPSGTMMEENAFDANANTSDQSLSNDIPSITPPKDNNVPLTESTQVKGFNSSARGDFNNVRTETPVPSFSKPEKTVDSTYNTPAQAMLSKYSWGAEATTISMPMAEAGTQFRGNVPNGITVSPSSGDASMKAIDGPANDTTKFLPKTGAALQ